jgi:hypothetical protein
VIAAPVRDDFCFWEAADVADFVQKSLACGYQFELSHG